MRPPLPALLLVALLGCAPPAEADYPLFTSVDAWCDTDEAGWWWNFWAEVEHEQGPRAVELVLVEGAIRLGDGLDSVMLASMDYLAEGQWGIAIHDDDVAGLECDRYEDYLFFFTAEDAEGDPGWVDQVPARREEPLR